MDADFDIEEMHRCCRDLRSECNGRIEATEEIDTLSMFITEHFRDAHMIIYVPPVHLKKFASVHSLDLVLMVTHKEA